MTARDRIDPHFYSLHKDMTTWRRDIHAHPELGFQETRTSDLVAAKLKSFGIEVHRGLGKTGVVGVLKVGTPVDARVRAAVVNPDVRREAAALPGTATLKYRKSRLTDETAEATPSPRHPPAARPR